MRRIFLLQTVVKLRSELISRVPETRLTELKKIRLKLITKLHRPKNSAEKLAQSFLLNLDLSDHRFLKFSSRKAPVINISRYLLDILTKINNAQYLAAQRELNKIKDKITKINPKLYTWSDNNWQKFNCIRKLTTGCYFSNLTANHSLVIKNAKNTNIEFKHQKYLWKKTTYPKKKILYINILIGFLDPDLFRLWWQHFTQATPSFNIWFYQEFTDLVQDIKSNKPQDDTLPGIFVNPAKIVKASYYKWFKSQKSPPEAGWSSGYNIRKLASFDYLQDVVKFSLVFDLPNVDPAMLDFLAYHELLHRQVGFKIVNNKTLAHGKKFKELELAYPDGKNLEKRLFAFVNHGG